MKILIDMNLSPKLVEKLSNRGISSAHWFNIGAPDAKDTEIMEYARDNNYIVLTYDLDFSAILSATHGQKPSVVQMRAQRFHTEQTVELLVAALLQSADELEKGAILTVDIQKSRLRLLPL